MFVSMAGGYSQWQSNSWWAGDPGLLVTKLVQVWEAVSGVRSVST